MTTDVPPVGMEGASPNRFLSPADAEGAFGVLVGGDDGAGPAVLGFESFDVFLVGDGLPRVAPEVEGLGEIGRWGVGVQEQRFQGRRVQSASKGGKVAVELELRDVALVIEPLGALVSQEPLEDVLAQRVSDQL